MNRPERRLNRKSDFMRTFLAGLSASLIIGFLGYQANLQSESNSITREVLKEQGVTNERLNNQINMFNEQKIETRLWVKDIKGRVEKIDIRTIDLEKRWTLYYPFTDNKR